MDHWAAKPLRVTNLFLKPAAVNHPSADNHNTTPADMNKYPPPHPKCNRFNDCKYCLPSQHMSGCKWVFITSWILLWPVANKESALKWEDMKGGTWFQIDLNNDSQLKSCHAAFKVSCCLFSRVKENIQENNRKSVYSSVRTLFGLSPFQHDIIIYMKAELTSAKP